LQTAGRNATMSINTLYELARQGDQAAIEKLFGALSARFRYFARHRLRDREDAEEVVQEALKVIYEKYMSMEYEQSFSAWAYKVLMFKIMTYSRTQRRREDKLEIALAEAVMHEDDGSLEARLLECLRKLHAVDSRNARILNLHYQGFTVPEICERLGLTRNNLYSVLFRARALLKRCLEEGDVR
jgi:RNA polymerase sigma-70 factor (ECF subfamily)